MNRPAFVARLRTLAGLAACAALLPGCWLFGQVEQIREQDVHFRNDGVRVNMRTVDLALAMYARDHHGFYPPRTSWVQTLAKGYYLPNHRLPPNPWVVIDENTQANAPDLGSIPPMGDGPFEPVPPGTPLGKGQKPTSPVYTTTTYGAMLYDASPSGRACVIYGVGQDGEEAIVVDARIRGRQAPPTPPPSAAPTPAAATPAAGTPPPTPVAPPASLEPGPRISFAPRGTWPPR